MNWEVRRDVVDGGIAGDVQSPHGERALLLGNFFEQTRITLQKWLILIYWWVRELAVTDASEEAEVSKRGN